MSLPKKKSRRIDIQGRTFRWALGNHYKILPGAAPDVTTFLAHEDIKGHGATLQAKLMVEDRGPEMEDEPLNAAVTPKDAKKLILAALTRGWDPNGHDKGSVFKLQGPMALEDYEVV